MDIILRMNNEEYSVSKNIDNPHTENVMYAIECLIKKAPLDKEVVEEYIRAWAEEIDKKV